jgi:hypothetical protein
VCNYLGIPLITHHYSMAFVISTTTTKEEEEEEEEARKKIQRISEKRCELYGKL